MWYLVHKGALFFVRIQALHLTTMCPDPKPDEGQTVRSVGPLGALGTMGPLYCSVVSYFNVLLAGMYTFTMVWSGILRLKLFTVLS